MTLAHSPHAPFNITTLDPVGICDRCCFKYYLSDLVFQKRWAGPKVITLNLRVCPRCLDELQENGQRTIVIGPDPVPLKDPRPPHYRQQAGNPPRQFVLDDPSNGKLDNPADGL